ncbi:MAG: oligoendopeptidase F family protein, partial [Bacilli bacterium]|nr:oligoendopeptidase F family protein [Bacilli bacterium]
LSPLHDYMKLRKEYFKLDEMHMYDIYMDMVEGETRKFDFDEAKDIVISAVSPLGDKYVSDLSKAFDNRWIDRYPNDGKRSGAYQWGSYGVDPYVSLNFEGTEDSVSTMAHELGHAMHSYYSDTTQEYTYAAYPIFLAEIASTVNEVLLNDYMVKNAKDDNEKLLYITSFLDKFRATVYRQTQFAEFEMIAHDMEQNGEALTPESLGKVYYDINKLYYGDNVISDDEIKYEWARIPHFYTAFYVYKYATGFCAALAISSDILAGKEGAKERYLEFLSSGGSKYPLDTLKACGVDMTTKEPILAAIKMFEDKLKLAKEIVEKVK